jgi:serine/threonine-protein kinase SRK2
VHMSDLHKATRAKQLEEAASQGVLDAASSAELCTLLLYHVPQFVPVRTLAVGAFGLVLHALDTRINPPQPIAVKLLPRGGFVRSYKTYLKREIVHTATLRHPLVIPLREAFLTPTHLGITSDFCPGGDLHRYLAARPGCRLPESEARWLFQQLAVGLAYCHARGVANRDLKLENLLLDTADAAKPLLRIADFGYSKHEMNSSAKTGVGTTAYMAPEVFLGALSYDAKAADWWSAGVVLYVLLTGMYPFDPADPSFAREVVRGHYSLPESLSLTPACTHLLAQLLQATPQKRAIAETVVSHPWVQQDMPEGAMQLNEQLLRQQESNVAADAELAVRVDAFVDMAELVGVEGEQFLTIPL